MSGFTETHCEICGERFSPRDDDRAEMYDPDASEDGSVICHAECGLARGFEVA